MNTSLVSDLTDLNELMDDDIKDGMGNDLDDAAMDLENGGGWGWCTTVCSPFCVYWQVLR